MKIMTTDKIEIEQRNQRGLAKLAADTYTALVFTTQSSKSEVEKKRFVMEQIPCDGLLSEKEISSIVDRAFMDFAERERIENRLKELELPQHWEKAFIQLESCLIGCIKLAETRFKGEKQGREKKAYTMKNVLDSKPYYFLKNSNKAGKVNENILSEMIDEEVDKLNKNGYFTRLRGILSLAD